MLYIGLDMHKKTSTIAVRDESGNVIETATVPSSIVFEYISGHHDKCVVCTDAYPGARPILRRLERKGVKVIVLGHVPGRVSGTRKKTDITDALLYSEIAWRGRASRAWIPPEAIEKLREYTRQREMYARLMAMARGAARQHRLAGHDEVARMLDEDVKYFKERTRMIESRIREHLTEHGLMPVVERLMEIPGIGYVSAAAILAEVGDIRRFESGDRLVSYAGLAPSTYQSGERRRHGKTGIGRLKRIMYLCAMAHVRARGKFYGFYSRLRKRGKAMSVALIAVARKLMLVVFNVLNGDRYRP